MRITHALSLALVSGLALSGCTVKDVNAPALSGPSTFGTQVRITASPEVLTQDGISQSTITITATDAQGNAKNVQMRAEISFNGSIQDFGRLSSKSPIANGTPITYTAPPPSTVASATAQTVTIQVTPLEDGDARGNTTRQIDIRLVPQGVIAPTNPNLTAAFTFSPAAPKVLQTVSFDAATTTNGGTACNANCTYSWNFGDGTSGTGIKVNRDYRTIGTYIVTLTVTDAIGAQAITSQSVTVAPGDPPTASFTASPSNPGVNTTIFFNASNSRPASGRTLVSYDWDFGKGSTGKGVTVSKAYDAPGTYTITLKVTDDAGAFANATQNIQVGAAASQPTAVLTASPTSGVTTSRDVFFDMSGSRPAGAPITEYRLVWGDNTADYVGTSTSASHRFSTAGTYVIRLTVTDAEGNRGTTTVTVTVS